MAKPAPRKKRIQSEREAGVCRRLREIRERMNYSQGEVARQLGITRERLASYEEGRAPIRFEFALRFCWQLVVSEEWLAFGPEEIIRRQRGQGRNIEPFFERQPGAARMCMSLLLDPVYHKIKPETLFVDAYDQQLEPVYQAIRLLRTEPRILLSGPPSDDHIRNLFHALMERWLQYCNTPVEKLRLLMALSSASLRARGMMNEGRLIENEMNEMCSKARESGVLTVEIERDAQRFSEFCERETPRFLASQFQWASNPPKNISKIDLPDTETYGRLADVNPQLPTLLDRLKKAAAASGQKTALAKFLDVPLASVSRWLAGEREPGGEVTLRLLKWVEQQERQK